MRRSVLSLLWGIVSFSLFAQSGTISINVFVPGNDIPEEAMVISAADIFDALTSDRPYRKALSQSVAIDELKKQRDVHYTKKIYDAFIRYLEKENPLGESEEQKPLD